MTGMATAKEILTMLLKLPASEPDEIAVELIRSLDEAEDIGAEEAWARELERRVEDVLSGRAKTEPWELVRKRLEDKVRNRRL